MARLCSGVGMGSTMVARLGTPALTVGLLSAGLLSFTIGISASLSYNVWSDFRPMAAVPYFADKNIFDLLDFSIANLLLPLNAMLIAIFAGWMVKPEAIREQLNIENEALFKAWFWLLRWVAPVSIALILYSSL